MKFKLEPPLPTGYNLPDARFDMPELLTPGRKPIGPVKIDWSHPIANQLHQCYLPRLSDNLDATGGAIVDLASNSRRQFLKFGSPTLTVMNGKEAYYNNATTAGAKLQPVGALPSGTVFLHILLRQYGGILFTHLDFTNNHRIYIQCSSEMQARPEIRLGGQPGAQVGPLDTIKKGVPITMCVGWTEGNSNASVYVDGALVGTYPRGTAVPGSDLDLTQFGYNARPPASTQDLSHNDAHYFQCSVWKRQLSAVEVASLHRDPYQFLIPA